MKISRVSQTLSGGNNHEKNYAFSGCIGRSRDHRPHACRCRMVEEECRSADCDVQSGLSCRQYSRILQTLRGLRPEAHIPGGTKDVFGMRPDMPSPITLRLFSKIHHRRRPSLVRKVRVGLSGLPLKIGSRANQRRAAGTRDGRDCACRIPQERSITQLRALDMRSSVYFVGTTSE